MPIVPLDRECFTRFPSGAATLVMLVVHNLDHMMQPHEWETLLTREIHGARVSDRSVDGTAQWPF